MGPKVLYLLYVLSGFRRALFARRADAAAKRELAWVRALCKQEPGQAPDTTVKAPANPRTLTGAGLSAPQSVAWNQGADPAAHSPLISRN